MQSSEVIIVGGGPAGSACAWQLKRSGRSVIILDRQAFPRNKLCAGWITPHVLRLLQIAPTAVPIEMLTFKRLHFYIHGRHLPIPTRQYSIRRIEFDHWLFERSGAERYRHRVTRIEREGDQFVIDGAYRCRFLVGAGGTRCPVRNALFAAEEPRTRTAQISTLEEEFAWEVSDPRCHLWFFENGLGGYAWYVPKPGGYLNVGIGGKLDGLKHRRTGIRPHWERLLEKLDRLGLVRGRPFKPGGWTYFLRQRRQKVQDGNALLIGDAAGLATVDMGEGIGPAIQSGLLAAHAILNGTPYRVDRIGRWSFRDILFPGR
jgi:menaquinone-9 beta-reductase